jgi:hypothetical protein
VTLPVHVARFALCHVRTAGHTPYHEEVRPGTRVEVRSRFESKWTRGFEVADRAESDAAGVATYKVRRRSDGSILPVTFAEADLREENRRSTWWI